jgi:hypothetical protein
VLACKPLKRDVFAAHTAATNMFLVVRSAAGPSRLSCAPQHRTSQGSAFSQLCSGRIRTSRSKAERCCAEGQVPARVAGLVLAVHQVRRDSVDTEAELLERLLDAAAPVGHWLRRPLVPWATDISKHAPADVSLPSCCSWATASRTQR